MGKFLNITEIIPDDMPDWADEAMDRGQLFQVLVRKIELSEDLIVMLEGAIAWADEFNDGQVPTESIRKFIEVTSG